MPCYYDVLLLFQMEDSNVPDVEACGCLPDCNIIQYEIEIVETSLKPEEKWETFNNISYKVGTFSQSGLSISFGDIEYQAIKRYVNHETITFISNVGGLLSLFLGVSLLSAIEIFYFLVVRTLIIVLKIFKKKNKRERIVGVDLTNTLHEFVI